MRGPGDAVLECGEQGVSYLIERPGFLAETLDFYEAEAALVFVRKRAGGEANSRLKARLKAGSDS
jgi:hypothetical protein